jgi:hypothetical protein
MEKLFQENEAKSEKLLEEKKIKLGVQEYEDIISKEPTI